MHVRPGVPVNAADDAGFEAEEDDEEELWLLLLPELDVLVAFDFAVSLISIASIRKPRPVVPAVSPFFTQFVQPTL